MLPTLSIIIPAKNEEHYLPLLLESIACQTVAPLEVIVADAGSTDSTVVIAQTAGAKVVEGGLPGVGRNKGAEAARGEVLLFLDADVSLPSIDFIQNGLSEMKERGLQIATADVYLPEGNFWDKWSHNFYNRYVRAWGRFHPHAPGFCIFVEKAIHDRVNGFDEKVLFCEDHDYAIRANELARFGFLNSIKIQVTTRRQERDGRLTMAIKYILAELHLLFLGPIKHDGFKYGFGYERNSKRGG